MLGLRVEACAHEQVDQLLDLRTGLPDHLDVLEHSLDQLPLVALLGLGQQG